MSNGKGSRPRWGMIVVALVALVLNFISNDAFVKADIAAMKAAAQEVLYIRILRVESRSEYNNNGKQFYKVRAYITNVNKTSTNFRQRNRIEFRTFVYNETVANPPPAPLKLRVRACYLAYFNVSQTDDKTRRRLIEGPPYYVRAADSETFTSISVRDGLCQHDDKHSGSVLGWILRAIGATFDFLFF